LPDDRVDAQLAVRASCTDPARAGDNVNVEAAAGYAVTPAATKAAGPDEVGAGGSKVGAVRQLRR
jgi:hypothetical protein